MSLNRTILISFLAVSGAYLIARRLLDANRPQGSIGFDVESPDSFFDQVIPTFDLDFSLEKPFYMYPGVTDPVFESDNAMTGATTISSNGIEFIKRHEGLSLEPYFDVKGYSVGYGHRLLGDEIMRVITKQEAEQYLYNDLARFIKAINSRVTVPLTQNQFDALVSFTYNLGENALITSTLLKKLNAGDYTGAAEEFKNWNKVRNANNTLVPHPVLTARRSEEANLFVS